LIEVGAEIYARDKFGHTALMFAAWENSNLEMTKALLNAGADVNVRSEDRISVFNAK
tara:strand:+ start:14187 stop:14357 length:171 start_codon:yes stop_codon:yes gene_type:complete